MGFLRGRKKGFSFFSCLAALIMAFCLWTRLDNDPRHISDRPMTILTVNTVIFIVLHLSRHPFVRLERYRRVTCCLFLMLCFSISDNSNNDFVVLKSLPSPDGRYTAKLVCEYYAAEHRQPETYRILLQPNNRLLRLLGADVVTEITDINEIHEAVSWHDSHTLSIDTGYNTLSDFTVRERQWRDVSIVYSSRP